MGHSWNPLNPEVGVGDLVFSIEMHTSADCSRFEPKGYFVEKTKRSSFDLQQRVSGSVSKLGKSHETSIKAGVGLVIRSLSAGVQTTLRFTTSSQTAQKLSNTFVSSSLEAIDTKMCLSIANPPDRDPTFNRIINIHLNSNDSNAEFIIVFVPNFPGYIREAEIGSAYTEVSPEI